MKEQQFDHLFNAVFNSKEPVNYSSKKELLEQKKVLMDEYFSGKISYLEFENKITHLK